MWIYTSTPTYSFMAQYLISKHRGKFTFTYSGTGQERLRKTREIFSQRSPLPERNMNPELPEYRAAALPPPARHSIRRSKLDTKLDICTTVSFISSP
jgi:hypothetical protein